MNFEELIKE